MLTTTSPVDSIERFAELSARLDDPFAERQDTLWAAGLDEARWNDIVQQWSTRLAAPTGAMLAARFGDVYVAATRGRLAPPRAPAAESTASRFLSTTAQPWRAEAATVGMAPPPGRSVAHESAGASYTDRRAPFTAMSAGPPPPGGVGPSAPLPDSPSPIDADMTLPVSARILVPASAAMPFVPPRPGAVYRPPPPPKPTQQPVDVDMTLPVRSLPLTPALPFAQADTTQSDRGTNPASVPCERKPGR